MRKKEIQNTEQIQRLLEQQQIIREEEDSRIREFKEKSKQITQDSKKEIILSKKHIEKLEEKSSEIQTKIKEYIRVYF